MTTNRNDFLDHVLSMSDQETIDYATRHGMSLEALQDLFCDLIMDISDSELLELAKKHEIDSDKTRDMIKKAIDKYRFGNPLT